MLLRPEERLVEGMMDAVFKFYKCGELVLDTCAAILVTAKARFQKSRPRRLVACVKRSACFGDAVPSLVKIYQKPVLSLDASIDASEQVVEEGNVFVNRMAALTSKEGVIAGLSRSETFPCRNILHTQCIYLAVFKTAQL